MNKLFESENVFRVMFSYNTRYNGLKIERILL